MSQPLSIDREARKHFRAFFELLQRLVVAPGPEKGSPEEGADGRGKWVERNGLFHFRDSFVSEAQR